MKSNSLLKASVLGLAVAAGTVVGAVPVRAQDAPSVGAGRLQDNYRIGPGDALTIIVFEKPELTRNLIVPPDGKIIYPFLGELKVAGLTLEDTRKLFTGGLKNQLVNPQVSIELTARSKAEVSILGAVKTPGKRVLEDGWHLLDLISASGGLGIGRPEWTRATLVRGDGRQRIPIDMDKLMSGDPDQNLPLVPGDTLLIREQEARNFSMTIMGEVKRPGLVEVPKGGSFFEIFTAVGGFNPRAASSKVRLTRKGQTVLLDMRKVMQDGTIGLVGNGKGVVAAGSIVAEPGDVLIVEANEDFFTVWGGVARAGRIEFPEDGKMGVLNALTIAGGPINGADLRNAAILRQSGEGSPWETIPINLEGIGGKKPEPKVTPKIDPNKASATVTQVMTKDFDLKPGDILFVPIKEVAGRGPGFGLRDVLGMLPFIGWVVR